MLALTVLAPGEVRLLDVPEPVAAPDQCLVAIEEVGICGTDLKIVSGTIDVPYPVVIGHELIGRIINSPNGSRAREGDRVLVVPGTRCGQCRSCQNGRLNLCRFAGRMGMDIPGGACRTLAVAANRVIPLPETVTADAAVLLQVLGTCVHAQRLVTAFPGLRAAVVGLGVSGIMHVQLLGARGLDVTAVGRSPAKLELARGAGASRALRNAEAAELADDPDGRFDLVVEAAGAQESFTLAASLVAPGGTLLVFGIHGQPREVAAQLLYEREITVVNARGAVPSDYEATVDLVADGRLDPTVVPVRRFPLGQADSVLRAAATTTDVVKFVLQP